MRVSNRSRKFHDPWGNKSGNKVGSVIRFQYLVGASSLRKMPDEGPRVNVNEERYNIDWAHAVEHTAHKFILGSRRSIERLRR